MMFRKLLCENIYEFIIALGSCNIDSPCNMVYNYIANLIFFFPMRLPFLLVGTAILFYMVNHFRSSGSLKKC